MFQTRLKELREAAGYKSQQAFADVFGVAQSTVGNWEAGKREPNYETTIRLANFFGVSVDYLINDGKGDSAMDTFGKRLAAQREKCGLSQKKLADLLSTTPTQLNYWEADEDKPDFAMVEKIAKALKVDTNYLEGIWTEDMYEDLKGASEEKKLELFNKWGVPSDLQYDYRVLCRDKLVKSQKPTEDELYTIKLLRLAEPGDRDAVRSILKKYESIEKKSVNAG